METSITTCQFSTQKRTLVSVAAKEGGLSGHPPTLPCCVLQGSLSVASLLPTDQLHGLVGQLVDECLEGLFHQVDELLAPLEAHGRSRGPLGPLSPAGPECLCLSLD